MKNLCLFTLLIGVSFCSSLFAQQEISGSFFSNGNTRTYIGAMPDNPQTPLRLVILFCGANEDAGQMALRGFNNYLGNNTIVVYPEPYFFMGSFGGDTLANDYLMVEELITHIASNYTIDANDICVGGFSNGAIFTYDLVCEFNNSASTRPYTFKAFAVVAGAMDTTEVNLAYCPIANEVPLIAFHGTDDNFADYEGVTVYTGGIDTITVYSSPTEETVDFWARTINGCNANPTVTPLPDLVVESHPSRVERIEYECNNCNNTQLYRIVGGPHSWPTSDAIWDNLAEGHNMDIVASELIADFFACSTPVSTVNVSVDPSIVTLYPNPVLDELSIEVNSNLRRVEIYSPMGGKLLSSTAPDPTISLGHLSSGMYFLRIETASSSVTKKIMKN